MGAHSVPPLPEAVAHLSSLGVALGYDGEDP